MSPRFDMNADTEKDALAYLHEPAVQSLFDGFTKTGDIERLHAESGVCWGVRAFAKSPEGEVHQSVYVLASQRGASCPRRTGVMFMHHIDEGLAVLRSLDASGQAKRAWCLHPLLQADADLQAALPRLATLTEDPYVLVLAMEYRRLANAYLSHREITSISERDLGVLPEVVNMLHADKVQTTRTSSRTTRRRIRDATHSIATFGTGWPALRSPMRPSSATSTRSHSEHHNARSSSVFMRSMMCSMASLPIGIPRRDRMYAFEFVSTMIMRPSSGR